MRKYITENEQMPKWMAELSSKLQDSGIEIDRDNSIRVVKKFIFFNTLRAVVR